MANRYQTALMGRLNPSSIVATPQDDPSNPRLEVPGLQPSVQRDARTTDFRDSNQNGRDDRDEPQPPMSKAPAGPVNYQDVFMNALQGKQYGQGGYAELEKELSPQGFQFQKNSAGQYRGRVKAPGGDIWDTALNEGNDNAFLGGGQGTTGAFGILNRGQEGLDAGGWSFGGPGSPSMPSAAPAPFTFDPKANPDDYIYMDQGGQQSSPFLEALLEQLRGEHRSFRV